MPEFRGYDVIGQVASGSTGTVFRARQVDLDRDVAIKLLDPALASEAEFLERFRAEARTLAGLADDHVVTLYDYVEDETGAWIVEQWVDGDSLAAVLEVHGRLSAEQSLGVVRGALTGLARAHAQGIVHGDVSTSNILVTVEGVSTLVDFGLSGPAGARGILGTPAFQSPEAAAGEPLTQRSDVYSAAAVLTVLLTGSAPSGPSTSSSTGDSLDAVIARALDADPEQRPEDAAALLAELEDAASRRYGVGWLSLASVAGLAAAGTATAISAESAVGSSSDAASRADATLSAAPVRAGMDTAAVASPARKGKGRLVAAGAGAAVVGVVVLVALTRGSSSPPVDAAAASTPTPSASVSAVAPSTSPSAAPAALPPAAFSGTYAITTVVTGNTRPGELYRSSASNDVGHKEQGTWVVTPACATGYCGASAKSTITGVVYTFAYESGGWVGTVNLVSRCVDGKTGKATGAKGKITVTYRVSQSTGSGEVPVPALTGGSEVAYKGCGAGTTVTRTWDLTSVAP